MVPTKLQDDLIQEFRAEQALIREQLSRFDPLATALRQPAARRLLSATWLVLLEVLCYVLALGGILAAVFHKTLYPLYLLVRFRRPEYETLIGPPNVTNLQLLVYGLLAGVVVLLLWLGRNLRRIRLKNALLARTGIAVKDLVGDLLQRKAALNALEQRHFAYLPGTEDASSVNSVRNPAYEPPATQPEV